MFGCNFYSLVRSLVPNSRADIYFLILIMDMLIIFAANRSIGELIVVILNLILFLIVKLIIYNNEPSPNEPSPNEAIEMKAIGPKIGAGVSRITAMV